MALSNQAILQSISSDRALGSAMLFNHRHRQASPPFHINLMDLWSSADELVVIEAFRQGAKTTLSEEFLLMEGAFGNFWYALIFGETYTKACQRIEAMKHEILTNQKLHALFGSLKGTTWSENKIVLKNGVAIEAHGWEEEIRGYKHLDRRPDRAYLDDIETKTSVRTSESVDAGWRKLHTELIPAMDSELGKVRMTGTPLADDCMVRRAAASKHWTSARFPICDGPIDDPATTALWPERYPMAWVKSKRDQFEDDGMLNEFMQEYMLVPTGAQGKPFNDEMIHSEDVAPLTYAPRIVVVDPARTVAAQSDLTGYVVVSRVGTRIYVHESGADYLHPDGVVELAFDTSRRHNDAEVAIEKNSLDEWLLQPMRARMLASGRTLQMRALNAPQDRNKEQFIMGLQSFFKAGDIVLVGGRSKHHKLLSQILNFPSGKRDALNALAYAPRVFSGVPVYGDFGQANIVDGAELSRNAGLLLCLNATGAETTAVLVAVEGRYCTVLADWTTPLQPAEALVDIMALIRGVYPGRTVTPWLPADVVDQVGRNPLVAALKAMRMKVNRAEYAAVARGSLTPMLRTEVGGRRLLKIDVRANYCLQAMASGYNWPIRATGERMPEPERSPARTLIEGLETLTYATTRTDATLSLGTNALSPSGQPYHSMLGARP